MHGAKSACMASADTARSGRRSMCNDNVLKLGFFGQNCSSGRYITLAKERWSASWDDNLRAAQLADDAGIDFLLPIGRWKGYGGTTDYAGTSFETITWATGLLAATKRINVFGTVHVPLFHPLIAGKTDGDRRSRRARPIRPQHRRRLERRRVRHVRDRAKRPLGPLRAGPRVDRRHQAHVAEDDFDFDGRYYDLKGVREKPKPYGGTQPLIMNAALSDDGRAFALRNCDALFTAASYGFDADSLRRAEAEIEELKEAAREIGREIDVYTNGTVLCRPTRQEALEYHQYLCVEQADWEAVDNMLRMRGRLKDVPAEERDAMRLRYATTAAASRASAAPTTSPRSCRPSASGVRRDRPDEPALRQRVALLSEEILPRLERKGLRMRDKYAIVGTATSDLGRTGMDSLALLEQAMRRAVDDAGLKVSDIDGIVCRGPDNIYTHHQRMGARLGTWTSAVKVE